MSYPGNDPLAPPRRLYPLRHHPIQARLKADPHRFKVVPAGRRSGKTELAKRKLVAASIEACTKPWPDPRHFAAAPTRDQAKAIYWGDLKSMFPRRLVNDIRETDLMIQLVTGAELWVLGMDKPQRVEGRPWDGGVLDEFADMKPEAWGANVRPALADRRGWAWLIGVPEGRNHYYDLYKYAISGVDPDWSGYTWPSADILPADEVEAARRQMDPLTFQQEFEASFVNFVGRAYYPFLEATHCRPLTYDPKRTISFCFDFNVDPGVAVVVQEQTLPGEYARHPKTGAVLLDRPIVGTGVIGEVWIPQNSNTLAVCKKLLTDYAKHEGAVKVYGDATGGARGSAKVMGSDWDLITGALRRGMPEHGLAGFGDRFYNMVPPSNPPERSRVNAMNTRLKAGDGTIRLIVDPKRAPHVVTDLEGVRLLEGGSGELDKKSDLKLTHISDALGYYVVKEFPVIPLAAVQTSLRA